MIETTLSPSNARITDPCQTTDYYEGSRLCQSKALQARPASSEVTQDAGLTSQIQDIVITPVMGNKLDLHRRKDVIREPETGEVLVRVAWAGICRSDICFSLGPEPGYPSKNHIAGHEAIGHVVRSHDPSLLDCPVAIRYLASTCGTCYYCLRDLPESCPDQRNFPKHYAGAFQQYMTVPWTAVMRLPSWVLSTPSDVYPASYTAALCSGSTALKALKAAELRSGDVLVVVGVTGAIGHLVGMMAKSIFNAKVIGVDLAWKSDSLSTDSDKVFDKFLPFPEDEGDGWTEFFTLLGKYCRDQRGECCLARLADSVIVTASSGSAFHRMEDYVCDGGSIICVGTPRGNHQIVTPLCAFAERQLTIRGVMMGGNKEAYQVLEYIRAGLIKPHIVEIAFDDVPKRMNDMVEFTAAGKTVVTVNGAMTPKNA